MYRRERLTLKFNSPFLKAFADSAREVATVAAIGVVEGDAGLTGTAAQSSHLKTHTPKPWNSKSYSVHAWESKTVITRFDFQIRAQNSENCSTLLGIYRPSSDHKLFKLMQLTVQERDYLVILVYYWHTTGTLLAYYWHTTGILLAYYWDSTGILLAHYWHTTGTLLAYYWDSTGTLLAYYWDSTGIPRARGPYPWHPAPPPFLFFSPPTLSSLPLSIPFSHAQT